MLTSIKEINTIAKNSGNVISTFSGCGGSSLGYKMAGFNVLASLEFLQSAADCYLENHPTTKVLVENIRNISGLELLNLAQLNVGELDILDGSPPCSSFSSSGKGKKLWGKVKKYSEVRQRTDDLFFEFIRIANNIKPKVIVAENVKGLTFKTNSCFLNSIIEEFQHIGYITFFKVLKACDFGAPQNRPRVIFVCIRKDLNKIHFEFPVPSHGEECYVTVQDVLKDVENDPMEIEFLLKSGMKYANTKKWLEIPNPGQKHPIRFNVARNYWNKPSYTLSYNDSKLNAAGVCHPFEQRRHTIIEAKRLMGFPDDFVLTGNWQQKMERLGRSVCPQVICAVALEIKKQILS